MIPAISLASLWEIAVKVSIGKLERLLNDLVPVRQQLREVHERSTSCMIDVAYYAWQSQMWGCHLSANTVQRLSSLGVALDISVYAEGPE